MAYTLSRGEDSAACDWATSSRASGDGPGGGGGTAAELAGAPWAGGVQGAAPVPTLRPRLLDAVAQARCIRLKNSSSYQ